MSEKNQKRNLNIDLIKVLAVFLVVLVHFFNRTGYYGLPSGLPLMLFATFIWSVAMACVPLFLITTGYLMKNAKYSKKFFINLLRVVGYYAAAVVVLTITDKQAHGFGLIRVFFENLFTFNHYSWYVNMYIGLYLMSPMLNAAFESLKTKKNQLMAIGGCLFLVTTPMTLAVFDSFLGMQVPDYLRKAAPNHWVVIWPFLYYFIGMFIRKYGETKNHKIKNKYKIGLFFAIIFNTLLVRIISSKTFCPEWGFLGIVLVSIFLFLTILNSKITIKNKVFNTVVQFISKNTLSIYLLSWIADIRFYNIINTKFGGFKGSFLRMPILVILIFIFDVLVGLAFIIMIKVLAIIAEKIQKIAKQKRR